MMTIDNMISAISAFGTLAAVFVAICGDRIQKRLFRPKLRVELVSGDGECTAWKDDRGSRPAMYYHLRVLNSSPVVAEGCSLMLRDIGWKAKDGSFEWQAMGYDLQLKWAPAGYSPQFVNINRDASRTADLVCLVEGAVHLAPVVYWMPNNFSGFVSANSVVRFHLQVAADNYESRRLYTYEVAWDGVWTGDAKSASEHIVVRQIEEAQKGKKRDHFFSRVLPALRAWSRHSSPLQAGRSQSDSGSIDQPGDNSGVKPIS